MNPKRTLVLAVLACALCGCQQINYRAEEVHRTISFPGFSDEIHATGITKEGDIRRADTVTHTTTLLGFSRQATYKGAELEIVQPEQEEPPAP